MAKIKITLRSDLCAASGAGFGNMIDTDVALDQYGIPYIPGRRIKGCLRQSAEDLRDWGCDSASGEAVEKLFGNALGSAGALQVDSACLPEIDRIRAALQSAGQQPVLKAVSSPARVPDLFTCVRGSTAMEEGKAKDGSLRYTRVVNHYSPLRPGEETCFIAQIHLSDPSLEELLQLCCQATRHIGSSRNRGLGEVSLEYLPEEKSADVSPEGKPEDGNQAYLVEYRIHLEEPLMIPGVENRLAAISSRAVIGCLSACWLKNHRADDPLFSQLFLSGDVQWTEMTPVAGGKRSIPVPRFLARLKGSSSRMLNLLGDLTEEEQHAKKKTFEGWFHIPQEDGFDLLSVSVSSAYHHSTEKKNKPATLYVEESLDSGVIYGGAALVPGRLLGEVDRLLRNAEFRFGRSRSAQYGACRLISAPSCRPYKEERFTPAMGEKVYAVLLSDLALFQNGINVCDPSSVRAAIRSATGLQDAAADESGTTTPLQDSCSYRELGGYHQMWQMRKGLCTVVCAGSFYQFLSDGAQVPREIRLGEFPQEGLGRVRLISDAELKKMNHLKAVSPDAFLASADASREMHSALLLRAAEEALKEQAVLYTDANKSLRSQIQIGRLRLMLAEATDLTDLVKRVGSIKTDDYRRNSLQLLKTLYATDIPTQVDPEKLLIPEVRPDPDVMLKEAPDVSALVGKDPEAVRRLSSEWKNYLSDILTLAYYQEGKEDE